MGLVCRFVGRVFPEVSRQLDRWRDLIQRSEDDVLCKQALSSISHKRFHAQGGSAYALFPKVNMGNALRFIVAFQTISDYLDNLCDRAGVQDEKSFRQLHLSMLDAVDIQRSLSNYYLFYPYHNDNGYLNTLVEECRKQIGLLPSYHLVKEYIMEYVKLYSELQTYKHLSLEVREDRLMSWSGNHIFSYPQISCWEFAAATGSTLGVFVMYGAACDPHLKGEDVLAIDSAYFPWVCGLHILLDYFIDAQEDMVTGDLNFTYYYDNLKHCEERLKYFVSQSFHHCSFLPYPEFHRTIVKGLLAMYLSDPKASAGMNKLSSTNIIKDCGRDTAFYHKICMALRFAGVL